jgi:hypothetical protein
VGFGKNVLLPFCQGEGQEKGTSQTIFSIIAKAEMGKRRSLPPEITATVSFLIVGMGCSLMHSLFRA